MGLTTLIDSRPLGLEIMSDPIKHGSGECVRSQILEFDNLPNARKHGLGEHARSKILEFDNLPNPRNTWVWKWCQTQNAFLGINFPTTIKS